MMAMKAESYLIKHNLDKTYWGKKIIAAEKRGRFTESNVDQSGDWQTCACGKQDPRIPRGHRSGFWLVDHNAPTDHRLYEYGMEFLYRVRNDYFHGAAVTLNKIEKRAAIVLRDVA